MTPSDNVPSWPNLGPEMESANKEVRAAEASILAAATGRDRSTLVAGAVALVAADAHWWAANQAERTAAGVEHADARWRVRLDDELGAYLLTDPVGYAAEIRATLRADGDPPAILLAGLPEAEWPGYSIGDLVALRMLDGDWRPVADLTHRMPRAFLMGNDLKEEVEGNRVIDALGRRDPAAARESIIRLARSIPRPDKKGFSLLAYALFQETRNLGMAVRPPKMYDFLGEPDPSRSRAVPDRSPVAVVDFVVRDWVASCLGIEPNALGVGVVESDPGLTITYKSAPDGPCTVRLLATPDAAGRVGRRWHVAADVGRSYHTQDIVTDVLRLGPGHT